MLGARVRTFKDSSSCSLLQGAGNLTGKKDLTQETMVSVTLMGEPPNRGIH